jgi:translation initiation factor 2-alpha kinase 4
MQTQRHIDDIDLNYVQAKKEFEMFMNNNTNIPPVSFNNSNNVLTHNNNNKSFYCCGNSNSYNNSNTSKQIVEEVKNELKNFNIISYLKQKHNISAVVVKTSNNSQRNNKMKEMLNHKQKHNERNNFNEENVLKKFKDLTDNANIVKNIQQNKIDNEDEHSESISDLDENVNQHVDVSLRKHNKFIKEFRNRPDDIKNYDNTKVYAAKRKKK